MKSACYIYRIKALVDGTEVPEDKALEEDESNKNLVLQTFFLSMPLMIIVVVSPASLPLSKINVFGRRQRSA